MFTAVALTIVALTALVFGHGDHGHDQTPIAGPLGSIWYNTLPGDGGKQVSQSQA